MKIFLHLSLFFLINLQASVSLGKEIYAKECASCHVEGKYFAANKKAKAWHKTLNAATLDKVHQDKNISLSYFQSKQFQEDKKHLKSLLQKYSKDRGKHNSCY